MRIEGVILFSILCLLSCTQEMAKNGRLRPLTDARTPPSGTVAQDRLIGDPIYSQGRTHSAFVVKMPVALTPALLKRGRERFEIYCSPCHGFTGYGDGMIVQRGFLAPPSYHQERLRNEPDGDFFDVITQGHGAMYSYGDRVPTSDRWAIVAYIRALQKSQNARLSDLTLTEQKGLQEIHE